MMLIRLFAVLAVVTVARAPASELVLDSEFRIIKAERMPVDRQVAGLRVEAQRYDHFDAIQWRLHLEADESSVQPLIEALPSADFIVSLPEAAEVTLFGNRGSHAEASDFQPFSEQLADRRLSLSSFGGRSSDGVLPFFNLASSTGPDHGGDESQMGGVIVAIGWSGDWTAEFEQLDRKTVRIQAGLKETRFRLAPQEKVQLPSILVMSYHGHPVDGQNKFRRLILNHFSPNTHPPLELMPIAASVHGLLAFNDTTEQNLTALARHIAATKLPLDTFWLDAGWNQGGFPGGQGNHQPDQSRFPGGLAPVGSVVADHELRFLAWFEPERVMRGTSLEEAHPEWLLHPAGTPAELRYLENDGFRMLDFGNPQARQWALDAISREVEQSQISIYRQDCNLYPAYFWNNHSGEDSVGLGEIRYINGLYQFIDQLRQRHPKLIIDSCASGGRRLDIELLSRSVCLWRSDSCWDAASYPRNVQAMSHGLSNWLPLHGLGSVATDAVSLRSGMGACASFAANYRDPAAVTSLAEHLARYRPVRELYAADYYPLTPWSLDPAEWLAVQYHDPKTQRGIVQAFHGATENGATVQLKLQGLQADANYLIDDWDDSGSESTIGGEAKDGPSSAATTGNTSSGNTTTGQRMTGAALATTGITITSKVGIHEARVWQYRREP